MSGEENIRGSVATTCLEIDLQRIAGAFTGLAVRSRPVQWHQEIDRDGTQEQADQSRSRRGPGGSRWVEEKGGACPADRPQNHGEGWNTNEAPATAASVARGFDTIELTALELAA